MGRSFRAGHDGSVPDGRAQSGAGVDLDSLGGTAAEYSNEAD